MLQRTRIARPVCAAIFAIITIIALTGCHKGRSFVVFGSGFGYGHHDHDRHRHHGHYDRHDHHRWHHSGHHGHHRGGHRY